MSEDKKSDDVSMTQFWVKHRNPKDPDNVSGAVFDFEAFTDAFGEEAADAVGKISHFTANFDSPETNEMFNAAKNTLEKITGFTAKDIKQAKIDAKVKDI